MKLPNWMHSKIKIDLENNWLPRIVSEYIIFVGAEWFWGEHNAYFRSANVWTLKVTIFNFDIIMTFTGYPEKTSDNSFGVR